MEPLLATMSPWLIAHAALTAFLWNIERGKEKATRVGVLEIGASVAALLLIFAFLTGGQGCAQNHTAPDDIDCIPSGPGVYGC